MSAELLVCVTQNVTLVGYREYGELRHLHAEPHDACSLVGNIYLGKVTRVMPSMQAAFVDIGLAQNGFLRVADMARPEIDVAARIDAESPHIAHYVRAGQMLLVQVQKDPSSSKGARLTTHIALTSDALVYRPYDDQVRISKAIADPSLRAQLRAQIGDMLVSKGAGGGCIVRTRCQHAALEQLELWVSRALAQWARVANCASGKTQPCLVYAQRTFVERILAEYSGRELAAIRVNDTSIGHKVQTYLIEESSDWLHGLSIEDGASAADFGLDLAVSQALTPEVPLRCGGNIYIETTRALSTIDVNSGAFSGGNPASAAARIVNCEAAVEIAKQLTLRNLSGIIVIDFIDMAEETDQQLVMNALKKALARDPLSNVNPVFSKFGLVELTRRRTRASIRESLSAHCEPCHGLGWIAQRL